MNTKERLIKVFKQVFEDEIDISNLSDDATLKEDVGLNSIGMLYMAIALEEEFGVKFTNEDFSAIITLGDVIARCDQGK